MGETGLRAHSFPSHGEIAIRDSWYSETDYFENGEMIFDYRLHEGVVRHSNALALMRAVGLRA